MDIYVNPRRVNFKVKEERHAFPIGYKVFIGTLYGLGKIGMAHEASVDEEELLCSLPFAALRCSGKTCDAYNGSFDFDI